MVDRKSPRRRWIARTLGLGALVGIIVLIAGVALGHPASPFFELDGNVLQDGTHDDWATLNHGGGSAEKFSGIVEDVVNGTQLASSGTGTNVCSAILPSGSTLSTCDDTATSGSTKDDEDFSNWQWIWQQANDKNDIEHVFAALYTDNSGTACTAPNTPPGCNPNYGHHFIVFGLDKLSNSGDASIGFWFTQNKITLVPPGASNSPHGGFDGVHKTGDILVQTDMTSGGDISRVEVFTWSETGGGPSSHPNLISQGKQAFDCSVASATAGFCGIATQAGTSNTGTDWPFLYKFTGGVAAASSYPASTLFEGGVDLNDLFGNAIPCLSTGIGETRQSQSETSVLVDFHLFGFDVCSANISIAPNGVNEVGGTHTITATVTKNVLGTTSPAPNGTVVSFTKTSGPGTFVADGVDSDGDGNSGNDCVTSGGTGTCSVQITSAVTGVTVVNASTTVNFGGGVTKTATTNGTGGNSGPVTKRWVDANISIGPSQTNEVGTPHTFTIVANAIPSGTKVQFLSITPSVTPTPDLENSNTCASPTLSNGGTAATCTLTINSSTAGVFTANATAQVKFTDNDAGANPKTVTLTRTTDGTHGSTGSATKTYVDAKVSIAPSKTNEVGQPHTFTVTVKQNDGTGFTAATAAHVDVTLTGSNGISSTDITVNATGTSCTATVSPEATPRVDHPGTNVDSNGKCTVKFSSPKAGKVTGHATATLTVGGVSLTRSTDGTHGSSNDAVKTYVDARISIVPNGKNFIYDPHTFTVTVEANDGSGNGFQPVGGINPTVSFTDLNGATHSVISDGCATTGTGAQGTCQVTITSSTTGKTRANAAITLQVGGVTLVRDTDPATPASAGPGGSGPAVKTWVSAKVTLNKTFEDGTFTHPGTACFTLTRNTYTGGASTPPPVTSSTNPQCGSGTSLSFTWKDLVPGTYTISETTTPAGYDTMADINFTVTGDVNDPANLSRSFTRNDLLLPGSYKIKKTISGSTSLGGHSFQFEVQPCGADQTCASPGTEIAGSPFTVDDTHNPITISGLDEGYYLVTELPDPDFVPDVNPQVVKVTAGDTGGVVTVTFNNRPSEKQGTFPTETTCVAFAGGTAAPLTELTYGLQNGVINSVSPGVFFYYATFTVPSNQASLTVDAHQFFSPGANGALNTSSPSTDFVVQNGQAFLYKFANGSCTKLTGTISGAPSDVTITYSPNGGVTKGVYVLGIKYTAASTLYGQPPCHGTGASCRYYFVPSRGTTQEDVLQTDRATSFLFRSR